MTGATLAAVRAYERLLMAMKRVDERKAELQDALAGVPDDELPEYAKMTEEISVRYGRK